MGRRGLGRSGRLRGGGTGEQCHQVLDPAEIGAGVIDAAAAPTGIEMDAPAVLPDHRQVGAALFGIEAVEIVAPQGGIKTAAGTAA